MKSPFDPATSPSNVPQRMKSKYSNKYVYMHVHSRIAHNEPRVETYKCPSVDGWTNSMCSLHSMEYYSITKKGELLTSAITRMNLEHILLLFSHSSCLTLRPHGLQHARIICPSPSPGACSNSCPSSLWCHPATSYSVVPFSCPQSFPASGSFPMSQLFTSGGQSIGASASTSVLPMNIQDWFPLGLTGVISLLSKGLSRVFSNTTVQSINSSALSLLHSPTLTSICDYMKNHSLD